MSTGHGRTPRKEGDLLTCPESLGENIGALVGALLHRACDHHMKPQLPWGGCTGTSPKPWLMDKHLPPAAGRGLCEVLLWKLSDAGLQPHVQGRHFLVVTGLETSGCKRCPGGAKSHHRSHICKTSFCLAPARGAAGESHLQSRG